MTTFSELLKERGHAKRFYSFQNLMQYRIRRVLLVCSLYDSFILEEDGQLYERLYSEHHNLNLVTVPSLVRVSSGTEAMEMVAQHDDIDLILTTLNPGDMHALEFAQRVKELGVDVPVVLLTYDERGLNQMNARHDLSVFEKVFLWQGDFRILIAIVKFIEDRRNVEHDTKTVGVQSIIVIEDNIHFYSSYLPIVYGQLFHHSLSLISEGVNASQRVLRMRARPKILLCSTYEEAWEYYLTYHRCILGVISDIKFPRGGVIDSEAGIRFSTRVKESNPDIPILLQSNSPNLQSVAEELGASFLLKTSPTLLQDLQHFMKRYFSFGDFVFQLPDGTEVARASDLRNLEQKLQVIPAESIRYHAERNHFSNWLKARTEFWLAHRLRAARVGHFDSVDGMRKYLLSSLREWRRERNRGSIVDFDPDNFDNWSFARIGRGSLGGKARGLGFVVSLLSNFNIRNRFPGIQIGVPAAVVLATDAFDEFLRLNNLHEFALHCEDDEELVSRFLLGDFPEETLKALMAFIDVADYPLAVRSSSLLEDSRYLPFAGVYGTYMLANNSSDPEMRREQFLATIKRVYASTYSNQSKAYIRSTPYRLEEEKMAVIIQRLVGTAYGEHFYPDFSGVVRSHNYYPRPPMKTGDGIATVALGLGETVVAGHKAIQFCPKYPKHNTQFADIPDTLRNSQTQFYTLTLPPRDGYASAHQLMNLEVCDLDVAVKDGTLASVGSSYSHENNRLYSGIARKGAPVVTFAPILQAEVFPLARILELMADMGEWAMNSPVEIEFAVNLKTQPPQEFAFLQMRPMVAGHELEELNFEEMAEQALVVRSTRALGNALINDVYDIVMTDPEVFERSHSREAAREFALYNAELGKEDRPYIAIGVGRWGTADPWLGIPVTWDQISGARVIVEAGLKDFPVEPSQGTHFFQNISCFGVGYFTICAETKGDWVRWDWLREQKPVSERKYTRHLRFKHPIMTKMNGHNGLGCICKPQKEEG